MVASAVAAGGPDSVALPALHAVVPRLAARTTSAARLSRSAPDTSIQRSGCSTTRLLQNGQLVSDCRTCLEQDEQGTSIAMNRASRCRAAA
jgi:hypothetical protein